MNIVDEIFFDRNELNKSKIHKLVDDSLYKVDNGELFFEYCETESLVFDDNKIKNANFNVSQGFGLRAVIGDNTAFAHSSIISDNMLTNAAKLLKDAGNDNKFITNLNNNLNTNSTKLYINNNPLESVGFAHKVALLNDINDYLRNKNNLIKQVSIALSGEWQIINIIERDGKETNDIRPLVRLNISVIVEKNGRMEVGSYGTGGRFNYINIIKQEQWQAQADEALRQALVNLEALPAPAGMMKVALGAGWPGILLHEAVGHGLEGDFNRKKTSAFSNLIGQQVAAKGVTVIDDGTIEHRRGSLTIDDEGTPSKKTILIEDGILKGYMQDKMNARLMGAELTGNGRRESYACLPMPRMTNTYMLGGQYNPEDIIASIDKGIYAASFSGGQVDITSGKFVFSASEAYLVENGKIKHPIKGATIIGNGPEVMKKIKMIGNDMKLDSGIGTCGKAGQSVPVGVGQPTLLIDSITVGGTEL